jgi:hypothetical protein
LSRRAPTTTTLLVSCARCHRLHEPLRPLDENPVCALCASGEPDDDAPSTLEDAELEF